MNITSFYVFRNIDPAYSSKCLTWLMRVKPKHRLWEVGVIGGRKRSVHFMRYCSKPEQISHIEAGFTSNYKSFEEVWNWTVAHQSLNIHGRNTEILASTLEHSPVIIGDSCSYTNPAPWPFQWEQHLYCMPQGVVVSILLLLTINFILLCFPKFKAFRLDSNS